VSGENNYLYAVSYNDGDVQVNKPAAEIRASKSRHRPPIHSRGSANSSSSSLASIGNIPERQPMAVVTEVVSLRGSYPIDEELDALVIVIVFLLHKLCSNPLYSGSDHSQVR
jgi:hypothetical protein